MTLFLKFTILLTTVLLTGTFGGIGLGRLQSGAPAANPYLTHADGSFCPDFCLVGITPNSMSFAEGDQTLQVHPLTRGYPRQYTHTEQFDSVSVFVESPAATYTVHWIKSKVFAVSYIRTMVTVSFTVQPGKPKSVPLSFGDLINLLGAPLGIYVTDPANNNLSCKIALLSARFFTFEVHLQPLDDDVCTHPGQRVYSLSLWGQPTTLHVAPWQGFAAFRHYMAAP
jgi:hypothetical protein